MLCVTCQCYDQQGSPALCKSWYIRFAMHAESCWQFFEHTRSFQSFGVSKPNEDKLKNADHIALATGEPVKNGSIHSPPLRTLETRDLALVKLLNLSIFFFSHLKIVQYFMFCFYKLSLSLFRSGVLLLLKKHTPKTNQK